MHDNISPGLHRHLVEEFAAAATRGETEPHQLAGHAMRLISGELAQVAAQRDQATDELSRLRLRFEAAIRERDIETARAEFAEQQLRTSAENTRPVLASPSVHHEYDDDGNEIDPAVGWDLSFGCTLTFGFDGDDLRVAVHTSDEDKRRGFTHRTVTREQVAAYARQLLDLVDQDTASAEPVCRCGHPESAHDAGECWITAENHDHPEQRCECAWYELVQQKAGA